MALAFYNWTAPSSQALSWKLPAHPECAEDTVKHLNMQDTVKHLNMQDTVNQLNMQDIVKHLNMLRTLLNT